MLHLAFGHPSVVSFTFWGLSDRGAWQPGGGLVDENFRPKLIYQRLNKLLQETWRTNLSTYTDSQGRLGFRGFYGKYRVELKTGEGELVRYEFHLRRDEENQWIYTVGAK